MSGNRDALLLIQLLFLCKCDLSCLLFEPLSGCERTRTCVWVFWVRARIHISFFVYLLQRMLTGAAAAVTVAARHCIGECVWARAHTPHISSYNMVFSGRRSTFLTFTFDSSLRRFSFRCCCCLFRCCCLRFISCISAAQRDTLVSGKNAVRPIHAHTPSALVELRHLAVFCCYSVSVFVCLARFRYSTRIVCMLYALKSLSLHAKARRENISPASQRKRNSNVSTRESTTRKTTQLLQWVEYISRLRTILNVYGCFVFASIQHPNRFEHENHTRTHSRITSECITPFPLFCPIKEQFFFIHLDYLFIIYLPFRSLFSFLSFEMRFSIQQKQTYRIGFVHFYGCSWWQTR